MMSKGPLESPADLQSLLPFKFLVAAAGMLLILFEASLSQWAIFYTSVPLISLAFIFYLRMMHPGMLPLVVVLVMGVLSEVICADPLGVKTTAILFVSVITSSRSQQLMHSDFLEIWASFSTMCLLVSTFRLIVYLGFFFNVPDLAAIANQTGMTILLFPIVYVVLVSVSNSAQRLFGFQR
jgi:hypothetical protein